MVKANSITFTTDKYYVNAYEANSKEKKLQMMWNDIGTFLKLVTKQGYVCKIYDDDTDIIVIEYWYSNPDFGGPYLEWINDEEADLLDNFRFHTDDYQGEPKENNE